MASTETYTHEEGDKISKTLKNIENKIQLKFFEKLSFLNSSPEERNEILANKIRPILAKMEAIANRIKEITEKLKGEEATGSPEFYKEVALIHTEIKTSEAALEKNMKTYQVAQNGIVNDFMEHLKNLKENSGIIISQNNYS